MTNPAATMRLLVTYAICIPVAILAGYFLVNTLNSPDYGNIGILGVIIALLLVPIFIKWHYPILIIALHLPIVCFFLKGRPSLWQVMVILSFTIAIVERALNSKKQFIRVPSMAWPMIYTVGVALFTAKLTGGFGLHALGGDTGGGKKYIAIFLGVLAFFAITSRPIPENHRKLYLYFYLLAGVVTFLGDLALILPTPFNYISLLIPPSSQFATSDDFSFASSRLVAFGATGGVLASFMLAIYGMRGIFSGGKALWRAPIFIGLIGFSLIGGHRLNLLTFVGMCGLMFFLEGLHRTRTLPHFLFGSVVCVCLLVPLADKLPFSIQRSLAVVPYLHVDPAARADAEGSSDWRLQLWRDTWPKVPQYLLLGKGYALTAEDFEMMGNGMLANGIEAKMDSSEQGLGIAGDYHSGPLSILMPFGIWGAISYLWLSFAGLRILYRNFKYSEPELRTVNTYFLAGGIWGFIAFLFIFGAYTDSIFATAYSIGFSVALNGGVRGPLPKPANIFQIKPVRQLQSQPA